MAELARRWVASPPGLWNKELDLTESALRNWVARIDAALLRKSK